LVAEAEGFQIGGFEQGAAFGETFVGEMHLGRFGERADCFAGGDGYVRCDFLEDFREKVGCGEDVQDVPVDEECGVDYQGPKDLACSVSESARKWKVCVGRLTEISERSSGDRPASNLRLETDAIVLISQNYPLLKISCLFKMNSLTSSISPQDGSTCFPSTYASSAIWNFVTLSHA
jgi:hypothetical protein